MKALILLFVLFTFLLFSKFTIAKIGFLLTFIYGLAIGFKAAFNYINDEIKKSSLPSPSFPAPVSPPLSSSPPSPPVTIPPPPPPPPPPAELTLELLCSIDWKRFEELVSAWFKMQGFFISMQTRGPDGGVDVWLFQSGERVGAVQCKAWESKQVGVAIIRELYGVIQSDGIKQGYLYCTSGFTQDAVLFADKVGCITLVTGTQFVSHISNLPESQKEYLYKLATRGDYKTPTCPACGIKMVARRGRNGRPDFWGCRNYPRCKAVIYKKVPEKVAPVRAGLWRL